MSLGGGKTTQKQKRGITGSIEMKFPDCQIPRKCSMDILKLWNVIKNQRPKKLLLSRYQILSKRNESTWR